MKNHSYILSLIGGNILTCLLMSLVLLSSCGVDRKIRKAQAVAYEYPSEFSEFCSKAFPVIPTYVKGKDSIIERTLTVKGDSIPCPENKGKVVYVKCPDAKVIYRDIYRVDTITEESTSKLDTIKQKLSSVSEELTRERQERLRYKKLSQNRLFGLIGLCILFIGAVILLFKKW